MKAIPVFLALLVTVHSSIADRKSENGKNTVQATHNGIHQNPRFPKKMAAVNETDSFSMTFQGITYAYYGTPQTFYEAEAHCRRKHSLGHLVSIHSHAVQLHILKMLKSKELNVSEVWIGGKRNRFSRSFYWIDGSKWNYAYWHRGSPAYYWWSAVCVIMEEKEPGFWHDIYCTHLRPFICEY